MLFIKRNVNNMAHHLCDGYPRLNCAFTRLMEVKKFMSIFDQHFFTAMEIHTLIITIHNSHTDSYI